VVVGVVADHVDEAGSDDTIGRGDVGATLERALADLGYRRAVDADVGDAIEATLRIDDPTTGDDAVEDVLGVGRRRLARAPHRRRLQRSALAREHLAHTQFGARRELAQRQRVRGAEPEGEQQSAAIGGRGSSWILHAVRSRSRAYRARTSSRSTRSSGSTT